MWRRAVRRVLFRFPRRPGAGFGLIVVTLVFLTCNLSLLRGERFPRWDASGFYAPAQMLVADYIRSGRLLLWNPWKLGGSPDAADVQVGAFSPITIVVGLLTGATLHGFTAYWLLSWWIGGLGMLLLARYLGIPPWGGVIAALSFLSCGFFTGHSQHTSMVHAFAFLPLILWRTDVALRHRSWAAASQAGALWGLAALAGYPGVTFLNAVFTGLWALGRLLFGHEGPESTANHTPEHRRRWPSRSADAAWVLLLVAAVGALVMSPAYYSYFKESQGYNDRVEQLPREIAIESNALHPGATQTFATPYLNTLQLDHLQKLWPYTDPSTASIYICATAVLLAFVALSRFRTVAFRWWLLGMSMFFLLAAMGQAVPLRAWLFDYLPPFRFFRHAGIFRGYYLAAVIILALYGCRDLATLSGQVVWRRLGIASIALGAAALSTLYSFAPMVGSSREFSRALSWTALLWLAPGLLAGLAWILTRRRPRPSLAALPWLLAAVCCVDAWRTVSSSQRIMHTANPRAREVWEQALASYDSDLDLTRRGLYREVGSFGYQQNNRNQVSKIPTLGGYSPFNNKFHGRWIRTPLLAGFVTGADRTWYAPKAAVAAATPRQFTDFEKRVAEIRKPVLLLHETDPGVNVPTELSPQDLLSLPAMVRIPIDLLAYRPEELHFRVDAPEDGWLLVTDRYAAGWRAFLDGRPAQVWRADFLFRAVEVHQGANDVQFEYRPAGYPGLLILSWTTLVATGLSTLLPRRAHPGAEEHDLTSSGSKL